MKNSLFILLLLSVFFSSCSSTKDTTKKEVTPNLEVKDDTEQREKNLADAGFIKATVLNKEGENGCGYLLQTEEKKLYIPISWIVPEYKVAGKEVYVKYTSSKSPQNGCNEATPIVIEEMKLLR